MSEALGSGSSQQYWIGLRRVGREHLWYPEQQLSFTNWHPTLASNKGDCVYVSREKRMRISLRDYFMIVFQ